jgi:hypothetical protein
MPGPRSPRRTRLGAVLSAALAVTCLQILIAATPAQAVSTGLVIREVYGGGGNAAPASSFHADFVELYNPTASSIPLTGLGLQYRPTSGVVGGNNVVALAGSVPAGQPFLVRMSDPGAFGASLPTPDQSASPEINMSGTNGQVLLLPTTTPFAGTGDLAGNADVIDMVGYGTAGTPANNSFETAPTASTTNATSAGRTATFTDTDNNSTDFAVGVPTPEASTPGGPPLTTVDPGDKTGQVGVAITPFDLAATGGTGPYTWSVVGGLPPGLTVETDGTVSGTPTTVGAYQVVVEVTDSAGTPATDQESFGFTIDPAGLAATDPGDRTGQVGVAITPFDLQASGGTEPYEWSVVGGLPPGLTVETDGTVSGTPTSGGSYQLVVEVTDSAGTPATDQETIGFTIAAADSSMTVTAPTMIYGRSSTVTVDVASSGPTPTGTVQVRNGSSVLGTAPVSAGRATISLAAGSLPPGETTLTAVYSGDSNVAGKSVPFSQVVVKATPSVRFKVKPGTIKAGETKVRIKVKVTADGVVPVRGKVKITVEGWGTKTLKLRDGRATLKLGVIDKPGKRKVKVKFLGSALVDAAKAKGSLTVIP